MPFSPVPAHTILRERAVFTSTNFISSDAQNMVTVDSTTAVILTIPLDSELDIPIGSQILIHRLGSGTVNINGAPGVGVNLISPTLRARFSFAVLVKRGVNVWSAGGDLG